MSEWVFTCPTCGTDHDVPFCGGCGRRLTAKDLADPTPGREITDSDPGLASFGPRTTRETT